LIKESQLCDDLKKGELVPIKLHMGEKGNTGHVDSRVVKALIDKVKSKAAKPFLTETNVLYQGKRVNAVDHLMLAAEHGFDPVSLGAPVIIADGLWGENAMEVEIGKKHFSTVTIARPVMYFDTLISIAHVTGHMLTGFAASVKNMGMGLASRTGKLRQHSNIKPQIIENNCVLCRRCIEHCPAGAIVVKNNRAFIRPDICIGCGDCISACAFGAVADNYGEDATILSEKMVEYAYGVLLNVKQKIFFNFAVHVTKNCDCMAKNEPSIVKDIGIFASQDPVACDKAAADMVVANAGEDVFKKVYPQADQYLHQLTYAEQIGLGRMEYELVEI
jgi:uncharacterized Fe-S center protein